MRRPFGVSSKAKTKQCPLWRLCFFWWRLEFLGRFCLLPEEMVFCVLLPFWL